MDSERIQILTVMIEYCIISLTIFYYLSNTIWKIIVTFEKITKANLIDLYP